MLLRVSSLSTEGMPVIKDPFFKRYISVSGLDHVEPLFRQLKTDRPDLQLLMVILPGKTPVYGEWSRSGRPSWVVCGICRIEVLIYM